MNGNVLKEDEWAREDIKKIVGDVTVELYNDGVKLIEF